MRDNDIIDALRKTYDKKEPDVLKKLDFSAVEMKSAPEKKLNRRYVYAGITYAAACLVVIAVLPFLIGGGGDEPVNPNPAQSVTATDKDVETTGRNDTIEDEAVTDSFFAALEKAVADGRIKGEFDRNDCFDITTEELLADTGARIFKFASTNDCFIYAFGEAYAIRNGDGVLGISGATGWDYNGDGVCDILMTTPYTTTGALLRTNVDLFDMSMKSLISSRVVLTYHAGVAKSADEEGVERYHIYDAHYSVDTTRRMLAVPYLDKEAHGYISYENKELAFVKYDDYDPDKTDPEVMEAFLEALDKAIEAGKVSGIENVYDYVKSDVYEVNAVKGRATDLHVFMYHSFAFIYCDGEVYTVPISVIRGHSKAVMYSDVDNNGKSDLILYGTYGSGIIKYDVVWFDTEAKTFTYIYDRSRYYVEVTEEADADAGRLVYKVYQSKTGRADDNMDLVGWLEYKDGKLTVAEYNTSSDSGAVSSATSGEKTPVETSTTTKKPAETTTKKPATTTTTKKPAEEPVVNRKVYDDPAKRTRIRFFKDVYHTDEYKSAADIPYGAEVYYTYDNDPGYIIADFKINIYQSDFGIAGVPGQGHDAHVDCFINNYQGERLEYSYTSVLAGDADGNLYYDENDVNILRKYLDNDPEIRAIYGEFGYSEELDYDCNGGINKDDLAGLLAEIENGTAKRNTMTNYGNGPCTRTALWKFGDALVLPHGLSQSQITGEYSVHKKYIETSGMSLDIRNKYNDPNFYNKNDLVVVYCYTKNGEAPDISEISRIWCTNGYATKYFDIEYSDDNVGQKLSKYALVFEIPNDKNLSVPPKS